MRLWLLLQYAVGACFAQVALDEFTVTNVDPDFQRLATNTFMQAFGSFITIIGNNEGYHIQYPPYIDMRIHCLPIPSTEDSTTKDLATVLANPGMIYNNKSGTYLTIDGTYTMGIGLNKLSLNITKQGIYYHQSGVLSNIPFAKRLYRIPPYQINDPFTDNVQLTYDSTVKIGKRQRTVIDMKATGSFAGKNYNFTQQVLPFWTKSRRYQGSTVFWTRLSGNYQMDKGFADVFFIKSLPHHNLWIKSLANKKCNLRETLNLNTAHLSNVGCQIKVDSQGWMDAWGPRYNKKKSKKFVDVVKYQARPDNFTWSFFNFSATNNRKLFELELKPDDREAPQRYSIEMQDGSMKRSNAVDLVIVVDGSGSIANQDFIVCREWMVDFVKSVKRNTLISSSDKIKVAVVQFSSNYMLEVAFDNSTQDMLKKIASMQQWGGGTNTGEALEYVSNELLPTGQGPDVPKVIVLLTDGQSNGRVNPIDVAKNLRVNGTHIISIGVGMGADNTELAGISSNAESHIHVSSYDSLKDAQKRLRRIIGRLMFTDCSATPDECTTVRYNIATFPTARAIPTIRESAVKLWKQTFLPLSAVRDAFKKATASGDGPSNWVLGWAVALNSKIIWDGIKEMTVPDGVDPANATFFDCSNLVKTVGFESSILSDYMFWDETVQETAVKKCKENVVDRLMDDVTHIADFTKRLLREAVKPLDLSKYAPSTTAPVVTTTTIAPDYGFDYYIPT